MKKRGRAPVRTCCGCGARDTQAKLVRVALVDGHLLADVSRTRGGRGAYLHRRTACWEAFRGGKVYVRSLRRRIGARERTQLVQVLRDAVPTAPAAAAGGSATA